MRSPKFANVRAERSEEGRDKRYVYVGRVASAQEKPDVAVGST